MRRFPIAIVLLLLILAVRHFTSQPKSSAVQNEPQAETPASSAVLLEAATNPPAAGQLLGDSILSEYGQTHLPPEHDLTLMSRLMENSLLLLKSAGNRPLSANEDWAAMLRGANAAKERFVSDQHPALNANGQLVDRWGTPLFFHATGAGRYELRSAGPDRKLWTQDDIHRNPDGSFRRGDELNPQSLFESSARDKRDGPDARR